MTLRLLSAYLFQFHRLPLPAMGTLLLHKHVTRLSIIDKKIYPGSFSIEFNDHEAGVDHLAQWLALQLNCSTDEAIHALRDYVVKLKDYLTHSDTLMWGNLGQLLKTETGHYTFRGNELLPFGYASLPAEKMIRSNAEHKVLAEDRNYTGEALVQLLKNTKSKKVGKRVYFSAAAIGLCLCIIIYMFIVNKNMSEKHQLHFKMNTKSAPDTYIILSSDE